MGENIVKMIVNASIYVVIVNYGQFYLNSSFR